jgi:nucleotide-binding universal stress UspA family protein
MQVSDLARLPKGIACCPRIRPVTGGSNYDEPVNDFAQFTIVQKSAETDRLIEAAAARAGAEALPEEDHVRFEGATPEQMVDALAAERDDWDTLLITPVAIE